MMIQRNNVVNRVLIVLSCVLFFMSLLSLINYMALSRDILEVVSFDNGVIRYSNTEFRNIVGFNLGLYLTYLIFTVLFVKLSHIPNDVMRKIFQVVNKILLFVLLILFLIWCVYFVRTYNCEIFEFSEFYHKIYFRTLIYFFELACVYSVIMFFILIRSIKFCRVE
jgi:hypothetical protein